MFAHITHLLAWRGVSWTRKNLAPEVRTRITQHVFNHISAHNTQFFSENLTGTVSSSLNALAQHMELIAFVPLSFCIRGYVQLACVFAALFYMHPAVGLIMLTCTLTFIFVNQRFYRVVNHHTQKFAAQTTRLSGTVVDIINNIQAMLSFTNQRIESQRIATEANNLKEPFHKKERTLLIMHTLQSATTTVFVAGILVYFYYLSLHTPSILSSFVFSITLTLYIADSLWMLVHQTNTLLDGVYHCQSALNLLLQPHAQPETKQPNAFKPQGSISFTNVNFQHNSTPLFQNLSVHIPAKQKVGVAGLSGGGKTTFINLILRFLEPNSGTISIDNTSTTDIHIDDVRRSITFVPQSPHMLQRSIFENIQYGKPLATKDEVIAAAKKAAAHDFIMQTPSGYDTPIGESGKHLSGGQRQRIALARAILKDAPIFILDEASSQLDSVSEALIQKSINDFMQNRTTIVVAHRMSALKSVDRILVFESGKIIEDDTPENLLKNPKSTFARLSKLQNLS